MVGDRRFWIEVQGMKLMNDQEVSQRDVNDPSMNIKGPTLGLNGYPVRPFCAGEADRTSPRIDGGTFNLIGRLRHSELGSRR